MEKKMYSYKSDLGFRWIKAESGNTYLCPQNALDGIDSPAEEQLMSICVDESMDPHNQ